MNKCIFRFSNADKITYDPSSDMMGDAVGSAFLLKAMMSMNSNLKVSWLKGKRHTRGFVPWYDSFDVPAWTGLKAESVLSTNGGITISSRRDFYVWGDLRLISCPKICKPEKMSGMPESYLSLHILQPTENGERSTSYVRRRALNFKKYQELCNMLTKKGYNIVRVGASYDAVRKIDGIEDLSMNNLSLDDSLRIIGNSSMFISGDTGLKLFASAMDVPCIVEIDEHSKSIGALSGCDPSLVADFSLGVSVEILYNYIVERIKI